VPDLARAVQQQSTVNPSGQVGAQPAPAGQEYTYTVRSQGRLQTPEEFAHIAVRSNPDGSVVRLGDVARVELGALNYQQIGRVNGKPGCGIAVFQAPDRTRWRWPTGVKQALADLERRFPADVTVRYTIDQTRAVSEGIREIVYTFAEALILVVFVVYLLPAELACDSDSAGRGAGVPHRHVRDLPGARLLDQHAVALRAGPGHRSGGRRRDRRGRSRGAPHRGGDAPEGRDDPGDARGGRTGGQHRAHPGRRVHPDRFSWAASRAG
jgi:hypothetical protein